MQPARGVWRRGLHAAVGVFAAAAVAGLSGNTLPLGGTAVGDLGIAESERPTDVVSALGTVLDANRAIATTALALGIVNALIISTAERKRELGVLRALGGLRGQVRKLILLEALAIALIGLVAGVIAGAFNTYFLVRTAASMIGGFTIPFAFPWSLILISLPIVLLIALVAAWWPARRTMNLRVVEAIGYE